MSTTPATREVFLAGDVCHELFVVTNTNIESPQRWYERHVAEEHDMAPPMQRHGGILLTKDLVEKLLGAGSVSPQTQLDAMNLPWTAPRRKEPSNGSTQTAPPPPLRCYYQAIYGLQEREQLPGSGLKTFRMMTLLSKEFIEEPERIPPTIVTQLADLGEQPILVIEDLKLTEKLWGPAFWTTATGHGVETILVKTNQPRKSIDSYLDWTPPPRSSRPRSVVFIANVTSLLVKTGGVHRSWDALVEESVKELFPGGAPSARWFGEMTLVLLYGSEGCLVVNRGENDTNIEFRFHWDRDYSYGALERRLGWVPGPGNVVLATLVGHFCKQSAAGTSTQSADTTTDAARDAWLAARACMILGHQRASAHGARKKGIDERALKSLGDQLKAVAERTADNIVEVLNRVDRYQTRTWKRPLTNLNPWPHGCRSFSETSVRQKMEDVFVLLGLKVISEGSSVLDSKLKNLENLVHEGSLECERLKTSLDDICPLPLLRVENLIAFERDDVEQLSYLHQLISDYRERPATRPLSIGVFGQPGAGKSFAVKQLLKSLAIQSTSLEFNLSPMNPATAGDLIACFRKVQSCALRDRELPLVFWDEFDSHELAWLQHFLAPMQDGEFHFEGDRHSIGRALFVFAGGTSHSTEDFKKRAGHRDNARLKAPDFKSRLKAFYDVPDISAASNRSACRESMAFRRIIQRALLIRQYIRTHARHIQTIDRSVAYELLTSDDYKSARELENVIEASALRRADHFGIAALAPRNAEGISRSREPELNIEWD